MRTWYLLFCVDDCLVCSFPGFHRAYQTRNQKRNHERAKLCMGLQEDTISHTQQLQETVSSFTDKSVYITPVMSRQVSCPLQSGGIHEGWQRSTVMLCYVMLCYVMLCYVMLCYLGCLYGTFCCTSMWICRLILRVHDFANLEFLQDIYETIFAKNMHFFHYKVYGQNIGRNM